MDSNVSSSSKQQKHLTLQQSFSNIQTQCSDLLNNVSKTLNPLFNPNSNNIFSALDSFRAQAKQALDSGFSRFASGNTPPLWARISDDGGKTHVAPIRRSSGPGLSADDMEERLAGVPVYALSNSNEEFVLVSGTATGKSLGLLFCKAEDAEALLNQMKAMDPRMRKEGSKVVALALSKERKTAGFTDDDFNGVPVFQSKSLILRSDNKSYRPVFFRKEDLEKSLTRASRQQNRLNPALKPGDIQVAVFEEIVKGMKENATSNWDDIVFIPPGFEVSTEETKD
ncbi:hypothetical protein IGI04_002986 [Brassica rapa subsp. trilocularis]|uniref:Protein TIC 22-like, chloroplastic n=1 Tax=Brassica rapa subsp. trilocularis TaxID=1813537 RepID=A0ABQ7NX62_BRACM|nr:hypothetical protein IGI04_002986 [Brassica rapa subsp. trilocularis]